MVAAVLRARRSLILWRPNFVELLVISKTWRRVGAGLLGDRVGSPAALGDAPQIMLGGPSASRSPLPSCPLEHPCRRRSGGQVHDWPSIIPAELRRIASTQTDPWAAPAPDLVERVFTADRPNRLWVADATRIPCGQGSFWLAAVRDAFSNRIVGWKTSDRCDTELVLGALEFAVWSRDIRDGELIHHSDRGSTYTAIRFANRLADNGIAQSMGSVGDSYDNALMENFFSTLKTELVYRRAWRTRDEAENALFAYIDGWYNTQRIQKKLGWRSPDEFETSYHHPVPAGT